MSLPPSLAFPPEVDPHSLLKPEEPLLLPLPDGEELDLEHTFRCGQIFRWQRRGETWYGPHGEGAMAVRLGSAGGEMRTVEVRAADVRISAREAWRFLGLDFSLQDLRRRLQEDPPVAEALRRVRGLRILRQDPWDCVAGYVCSQWNNIPKIELSTERIARAWGRVVRWPEGVEVAALPRPERLAALAPEELRASALGYRCRYLVDTARAVAGGSVRLEALRSASYEEALANLLCLPGVGRKVADCILLFALDKPQALPVDVWVRRVIHELYGAGLLRYLPDAADRREKGLSKREHDAILRFAWDRWGVLSGYAQQYLFHARRLNLLT